MHKPLQTFWSFFSIIAAARLTWEEDLRLGLELGLQAEGRWSRLLYT